MRTIRYSMVIMAALLCVAAHPATGPAYVTPDGFDFKRIIGPPPADDSAEHRAEVETMLGLQVRRTPEEERRCRDEEDVTVFAFATVLGDGFDEKRLPVTAGLMHDVYVQAKAVSAAAKKDYSRKRPPAAEPRIHPCVKLEDTPSYPSGHAVRGVVWATLLAEIFPEDREPLMLRGRQIGDDRFLAGMHYPSDVVAGQKLGAEIARSLLANEDFKARLAAAKAECLAAVKAPRKAA